MGSSKFEIFHYLSYLVNSFPLTHFLFVLQKYQEHLIKTRNDGHDLDAVIELLQHTSEVVSLFNDRLYINSSDDQRLHKLNKFSKWMCHWASETEGKSKNFISSKLWFDLQSMCLGFQSLVHYKMTRFPSAVIKPAIVNQDCVENHFCQISSRLPVVAFSQQNPTVPKIRRTPSLRAELPQPSGVACLTSHQTKQKRSVKIQCW